MSNGNLSATGGVQIASAATLSGSGSILADVTNAGTITMGDEIIFTAVLSIDGDYTQLSTGQLDVYFGMYAPELTITGHAALAGTLRGLAQDGYVPAIDDSFTLFTYGSHSGTFADVLLPPLSEGTWQVDYGSTSFDVSVV